MLGKNETKSLFHCRLRKGCGAGCNSGGNIEDSDAGGLSCGSGNGTGGDSHQSSVSHGGTTGPAPPHSYQPHSLGEATILRCLPHNGPLVLVEFYVTQLKKILYLF